MVPRGWGVKPEHLVVTVLVAECPKLIVDQWVMRTDLTRLLEVLRREVELPRGRVASDGRTSSGHDNREACAGGWVGCGGGGRWAWGGLWGRRWGDLVGAGALHAYEQWAEVATGKEPRGRAVSHLPTQCRQASRA